MGCIRLLQLVLRFLRFRSKRPSNPVEAAVWDRRAAQSVHASFPELVAEDIAGELALAGNDRVHAVAQHRAHAHQEQPLADDVLARATGQCGRKHCGHEIAAKRRGQRTGVEPVGFDLRVGDQAS